MLRPLPGNPDARIERQWYVDPVTGDVTIAKTQDARGIVADTRAEFNSVDERARFRDGFNLMARIPNIILFDLHRRGILSDVKAFKKWLNDPDNRFFRVRPGVV